MNIWTHMLGFIVVVASLVDLLRNYSKDGFDDEVSILARARALKLLTLKFFCLRNLNKHNMNIKSNDKKLMQCARLEII